ncbi:MAG: helix-turn-helix domain-containing protein, partial [Candidatus Eremiobacteraeota bacterium]|nr:helix-turn-helix domain-containing protein [Candidatus Eremiobacteraeota bacterium]
MPGASDALGERFRAAREARGLSLSDVAEQIRIRSVYLAAIEDENWRTIGAPVYIRGFLRTYARFLGLDPEEAVAAFNRAQPAVPASIVASEGEPATRPAARHGSSLVWIAAVVAVLLIAFVVYNELTLHGSQTTATEPSTGATVAETTGSLASPSESPLPTAKPVLGVADGSNTLALVLSAPSWLRVTVDGSVSMEGTFPAGTTKTFHGKNALVRIG